MSGAAALPFPPNAKRVGAQRASEGSEVASSSQSSKTKNEDHHKHRLIRPWPPAAADTCHTAPLPHRFPPLITSTSETTATANPHCRRPSAVLPGPPFARGGGGKGYQSVLSPPRASHIVHLPRSGGLESLALREATKRYGRRCRGRHQCPDLWMGYSSGSGLVHGTPFRAVLDYALRRSTPIMLALRAARPL